MIRNTLAILWVAVIVLFGSMLFYYLEFSIVNSVRKKDSPSAVYDLSGFNFDKNNVVALSGGAYFYKDTLLNPADSAFEALTPTGYSIISKKWNRFLGDSKLSVGHGYGTFAFKIRVPKPGMYAIKANDIKSSYKIFINGTDMGGSGVVGKSAETMKPSRYQMEYYFYAATKTIDVLIQVSNFQNRKGGLTGLIHFGSSRAIALQKTKQVGIELFIVGSLFILFIYHLVLYAFRRRDKSTLYFSMLCLIMFLRLGYIGERIFLDTFSFLGWYVSLKTEYISFFGIPVFTALFLRELFPKELSKHVVKATTITSISFVVLILSLSPTAFSYLPIISLFPFGILAVYLLAVIFIAMLRGREFAKPMFVGFFVYFLLSLHDALYYAKIINSVNLMPLGLFVATFSQAYVLARKSSSAYLRAEKLSDKLSEYAHNLEDIVRSRTKEIESQKHELEHNAKALKENNKELVRLVNFKQNMTNMMIHDLKAPLNSIVGFAELSADNNEYSKYILNSGWEMENLIQNILDVDRYESTEFKTNKTETNLHKLVNYAYENVYFIITGNKIDFINQVPADINMSIDKHAIYRLFTNIFSNAVKYGGKNITLKVDAEMVSDESGDYIKISIYNSGNSIAPDKINRVFNQYDSNSDELKDLSYSSGIGLTFCKLAVDAHGGSIDVESGKNKGVTFWFTIPL